MKRFVVMLGVCTLLPLAVSSQSAPYKLALGLRAGQTGQTCGVTLKKSFGQRMALDAMVGYADKGISLTGLFERHFRMFGLDGLRGYTGIGMHYSSQTGYDNWYDPKRNATAYVKGGAGYGVDAVLGIEYKVPVAPVAFGLDIKPYVTKTSTQHLGYALDPGINVRIAF